jgi:SAM-dependent methyltransferase
MQFVQNLQNLAKDFRQYIYDWHHKVETREPVPLEKLHIESENLTPGLLYDPTSRSRFRRIIRALRRPSLEGFTFIDLGCGKGRVLLLASLYPFKKIIGVEFSPELAHTAEMNLNTYRPTSEQKCKNTSVVCLDAAHYKLPPGPLLIYMYNPFQDQVMKSILSEIKRVLDAGTQDLYVAYLIPKLSQLLKNSSFLVPVHETPVFSIFKGQRTR